MNTETDAIRSTLAHRVAELTEQNKAFIAVLEPLARSACLDQRVGNKCFCFACEARAALKK